MAITDAANEDTTQRQRSVRRADIFSKQSETHSNRNIASRHHIAYRTIRRQTNSRSVESRTG